MLIVSFETGPATVAGPAVSGKIIKNADCQNMFDCLQFLLNLNIPKETEAEKRLQKTKAIT